jgi:hypothetical protein
MAKRAREPELYPGADQPGCGLAPGERYPGAGYIPYFVQDENLKRDRAPRGLCVEGAPSALKKQRKDRPADTSIELYKTLIEKIEELNNIPWMHDMRLVILRENIDELEPVDQATVIEMTKDWVKVDLEVYRKFVG